MGWLPTVVTVEPAGEPVTLVQVKAQCRAEGTTADDDLLTGYIEAARTYVESYCGIRLVTQTIAMRCRCFRDFERLADAPLQEIVSVAYLDGAEATQTLDPALYQPVLFGLSPRIRLKRNQVYPVLYAADDAITVTAKAGFGAASAVPAPIVQAMLLLIEQWYDNRAPVVIGEAVNELPNGFAALLTNYRRAAI